MKVFVLATAIVVMAFAANAQTPNKKNQKEKKITEQQKDSVYYTCIMHTEVKMDKPGICPMPMCGMVLEKKTIKKIVEKKKAIKTYACTMHPKVEMDKSGKCSECGMDLKEKQ